jgi:hypothetical protein
MTLKRIGPEKVPDGPELTDLSHVIAQPHGCGPGKAPAKAADGECMIEDPKPKDPSAEGPGPDRLEKSMDIQREPEKGEARLTREIQIKIGQQLRAMYAHVVDQGVPERFVELLRQLEEDSKKGKE